MRTLSIKLSEFSGETVARLQRVLRLPERPPILRLALAMGLRQCNATLPAQRDSKGPEIPLKVLFAGRELLFDSLVLTTLPEVSCPMEAGERRRIYKCLVDYGIEIIAHEFESAESPDFLVDMVRRLMQPQDLV